MKLEEMKEKSGEYQGKLMGQFSRVCSQGKLAPHQVISMSWTFSHSIYYTRLNWANDYSIINM